MEPDHTCHAFNLKTYVMRRRRKRKMNWKTFKRESKHEAFWQKTCSICGKVLEEGPVPELTGWTLDLTSEWSVF